MSKKIVILGASGFVGTTLTERLLHKRDAEVVPVIHSAGSAWRLARLNIPLTQVDINDQAALRNVLRDATHVVNCTRGSNQVMLDGFKNILDVCRQGGVARFVHLSSVAVYGDPPHPDSHHEDAPTRPEVESYGLTKLEQDRMVEKAAKAGLPSVVLCPPNISGPYSGYLAGIVNGLRTGAFAVVDGGLNPCNLIDVRNLCHAIELGLNAEDIDTDGRRMFVTDDEAINWKEVVGELLDLAGIETARSIGKLDLVRLVGGASPSRSPSIVRALRHLVSSDVRTALRKDPLLGKVDHAFRTGVAKLGTGLETKIRLGIEGPTPVHRPNPYASLAIGLCAQQLREVRHLSDRAEQVLKYSPPLSFKQSMADFRAWYRNMHGMNSPFWAMSRYLYE